MFKKLGAGEYPLKTVFWMFGLLGFLLFYIITSITHSGILRLICPYRTLCTRNLISYIHLNAPTIMLRKGNLLPYIATHIVLGAAFAVYMYVVLRSLWKCCETYEGSKFWEYSAKFILISLSLVCIKSLI